MGWLIIAVLGIAIMAILIFLVKIPRKSWEFVAAALMLGLAGYAWQGNPSYKGAPKDAADSFSDAEREYQELRIAQRKSLDYEFSGSQQALIVADSYTRRGDYEGASAILNRAIEKHPENPDLWVALGNVIDSASDGQISPAAQYAYRKAATIKPDDPRPIFDMGLALAQSGRLEEARSMWMELIERGVEDENIRASAEAGIARINQMLGVRKPAGTGESEETAE